VDLRERFGANLRRARKRRGWSQEELGERCELHRTEVSLLERGKRRPRLETLVKLAGGLDVTLDRLCDGISWSPEKSRLDVVAVPYPPGRVKRSPALRPSR
jgi:transcriptional regulator with XRE-family HTH domain